MIEGAQENGSQSHAKIIGELFTELKLQHKLEDILAVMQACYLKHSELFKVSLKEIPGIVNSIPLTDVRYRSKIIEAATRFYLSSLGNSKGLYVFAGERRKPKD